MENRRAHDKRSRRADTHPFITAKPTEVDRRQGQDSVGITEGGAT